MTERGFTLLELMLTTVILSVFLSFAVPAGVEMIKSVKVASASNSLHRTLKFARSEAIVKSRVIRICASRDGANCSREKNWGTGWLVYVDEAGKSVRTPEDPVLRFFPAVEGVEIFYNLNGHTVKFNEMGRLSRNGSFYICDPGGYVTPVRLVMVHSGRVRQTSQGARCS